MDLGLQIKGLKGVRESLKELFTWENFTGDNQLTCDSQTCGGIKTDSSKGININKLPMVMTLCLYRFELDYETWSRKKLDDKFEYPLELDMLQYMSEEAKTTIKSTDDHIYELKSIVIHRGGAYGGHYYAYIKDDLGEGNWHLQDDEDFEENPTEVVVKKFNPEDHMTEEMKKEAEEEKNKNNKKKKKKKEKKEKEIVDLDFSKCDFPIAYSSKRLVQDWYEFNDSAIGPIQPGVLQSKFGGSNGSAYMLVYRLRKMNEGNKPTMPAYLNDRIQELNKTEAAAREVYNNLKD